MKDFILYGSEIWGKNFKENSLDEDPKIIHE